MSPATATFYRCALALPGLSALAAREVRRYGLPTLRSGAVHSGGGILLGIDFALRSRSIELIGAGIATVVVSVQVVVAPLLAWLVHRTVVPSPFLSALPVLVAGITLASGALTDVGNTHLLIGAGLAVIAGAAYAGYIFVAGHDGPAAQPVSRVFISTAAAGVSGTIAGTIWGAVDFTPGWESMVWLLVLALVGQVLGWILIGRALPHLASEVGATLLLMQPVLAVLLGIVLIYERPTPAQLLGCVIVVAGVGLVSIRGRNRGGA